MAKLSEQEFKKELSSNELKTLYLIYGSEKYLVKKYTEAIVKKAVGKDPSEFDYYKLNSDTPLQEIYDASQQISMFSDKKCVNVTDYDFNSLSDSDLKELEKFCTEISPSTVLVFSMPTLDTSAKKKESAKGRSKFSRFVSCAEKNGSVLELEPLKGYALETQLIKWAEKNGCRLNKTNAARIISITGTDMNLLKNETDKLCGYANGREIIRDMIDLLCVRNTESKSYMLSNHIMKKDFNATYQELDILFGQNERPEIILSGLSSAFIDMYRAKVTVESGRSFEEAAKEFKYGKREFVLRNAASAAAKYSSSSLKRFLDTILETDIKMKSSRADSRILLEKLVAEMLIIVKEEG